MAFVSLRRLVVAMILIASVPARAQIGGLNQFSDNMPGRQYHYCEQGNINTPLHMWKAFDMEGKALGYGLTASPDPMPIVQLSSREAQPPLVRVSMTWPRQLAIQRRFKPAFDRNNVSLVIVAMTQAEMQPKWKKGIWTQYIVDRGHGVYLWQNGPVTNVSLPVASPAFMTEPNDDRSFRFHVALPEFLAWANERDVLTVHKVAVAKGSRGKASPPFGERRLLYSMQVDIKALEAAAKEAIQSFETWERGLQFKSCPIQIEEDESAIIVTDGASTNRAAGRSVMAHLIDLERQGRVARSGEAWTIR